MLPVALADGSWIFLLVLVLIFAGLVFGYYTRTGSGIDQHPTDGLDGSPGAEGQTELSGRDEGEGSTLDTHGTR
jgi:hypothetical protein